MWDAIDLRKIQKKLMPLFYSLAKSSIIQRHYSAILVKKPTTKINSIAFTQNDIVLHFQLQSKPWKLLHTISEKTQVSFRQFAWGDFHAHLLASLTLISMKKKLQCDCQEKKYTFLLYRYWWNTRIFPFTKKSYLHSAQWRYYFYPSRVRILVSPWLLTLILTFWNRKS